MKNFSYDVPSYLVLMLRIHEKNTKENHNRVVLLYVIITRLLFSSNFLGLENINLQTFFTN